PDVVVACFGMNDGTYRPFDEDLFARYQAGIRKLVTRTRDEARARLVLLTPPPFDPYRRKNSDPEAKEFGYRFPAVDYDQTLDRYSDWLLTLQSKEILVADVHKATNDHLKKRRDGQVSFYLAGDAIHPGPTGHWLMAQTLLLAWHAPADVAEATIDATAAKARSGDVRDVAWKDGDLVATWRTPLPMPIDPEWDARSIAQERVADRLNRYRLTVTGLPAPRYHLWARMVGDDAETDVAVLTREQLAEGIDLTSLATFPTVKASQDVLDRLKTHHQGVSARWRKHPAPPDPTDAETPEEIRKLCQPGDVSLRLSAD
ncbi:MAG: GDSL-type esterase/lipase family protein, partial [Isosphaeraceae bacterium]